MSEMVPVETQGTVALVSEMRRVLAEASLLSDIRKVIEAARTAEDMHRRQIKLLEAEGLAVEAVHALEAAADELALLNLDACAKAGEIIEEMGERGELSPPHRRPKTTSKLAEPKTMAEIVGETLRSEDDTQDRMDARAFKQVDTWRKIAQVPPEVRSTYVRTNSGRATVAGLLRFAKEPTESREPSRTDVEIAYDDVVALLGKLIRYNPEIISGHATNTRRATRFRKLLSDAEEWVGQAQKLFGD